MVRLAAMPDTPLKRWRLKRGWTQGDLARRCEVEINTVARWERAERLPRGEQLDKLIDITRLPTDALVRPVRYLQDHPDFLQDYASPSLTRGRPKTPPKPRGRPRTRPPEESA
jgi:transcriptional regulator with XRE-family HTH domain